MRIVNRKQFLAMPSGTLYSHFKPFVVDGLYVKYDNCGDNDWFADSIDALQLEAANFGEVCDKLDDSQITGKDYPVDFHCTGREGLYDEDQLFAVFSKDDVRALIKRLEECL